MEFKQGKVIYYLDRNAYNVNNPKELVIAMNVVHKKGKLMAKGKVQKYYTIEFELNDESIKQLTLTHPSLFATREEALDQYDSEVRRRVEGIMSMTKEELAEELFNAWDNAGSTIEDVRYRNAMKEKIYEELGVEL